MTKKVIIYNHLENGNTYVCVCTPMLECGISIEEIARKDLPAGTEYKIVDESELPADSDFFKAWELTINNPDGVAIGYVAWEAEQRAKQ
jgi:hypothetical protein